MKKNGFTLVEVLAVIGVLAALIVIFVPEVLNIVDDNNNEVYKIKEKQIIDAVSAYTGYDSNFESPIDNNTSYVTLTYLMDNNYLDKIIDNNSNNICTGYVAITNNSIARFDYEVCLMCDGYTSLNCSATIYEGLNG